jgi:hypothetical protein
VEFALDPRIGVDGHHAFVVEPLGRDRCTLRHEMHADAHGATALNWVLVIRALHDACVEDALDCAEHATTGAVARPARWSVGVRVLRRWVRGRPRERAHAA